MVGQPTQLRNASSVASASHSRGLLVRINKSRASSISQADKGESVPFAMDLHAASFTLTCKEARNCSLRFSAASRTGEMVILGTQYAGEMKKGVFSVMHYLMPKIGILSLHSGCNQGKDGDVSLFFGLSGG